MLERFRTPPGGPGSPNTLKNTKGFCCISRSATDIVQIVQISPWEVPKPPPRAPRSARDAPGEAQEASRQPHEPPGAPQERPQSRPAVLAAKLGPTGTKKPSGDFRSFLLSDSIAKAVLWAKLAQAYAQHRFTSLCNFYMWISTATDSRSIDR